ncbi:permease [Caproiciproducens sp. MSJ-32]|uniref:permease n=1 Tax=Caproiciproducens sp. MSJ-32 TaxID=2841527 RepID=UPI001C106A35|nr:permease [Caproiciproducens sp. MSJ-32]MBU5454380.1 permease [Caproiciproducens sp. MSJ-32]
MSSFFLYSATVILFLLSYKKDKKKTKKAFIKGLKSLENILPQFLGIVISVGLILAILTPETIRGILGTNSAFLGIILSALIGTIVMMPTFVAFSTADMLINNGAGMAQVAALVSTLTLIGLITIPLEAKYIGKRATVYRNIIAFIFSILVAFFVEKVIVLL